MPTDLKGLDPNGLDAAIDAIWRQWKLPEEERLNGATTAPALARAAILAYEAAKPKEAEGWHDIASAPFAPWGTKFYAVDKDGEVRICWRHKPSSHTDDILTIKRSSKFKAVGWRAMLSAAGER
ncbi:hypothetical protein [Bosea sp. LjRoot237]|uniref:hypothetical protein n=1 Tax=Bosea sp. LjRoot237 TaxID=3342292 RepID=UPI003ECD0115